VRRELIAGILCIALLIGVKLAVGRTDFGQQAEVAGYALAQKHLAPKEGQSFPVAVIDISSLAPAKTPDGIEATPRDKLLALIARTKALGARAAGVDVDLSPDFENRPLGYITAGDPAFFQSCEELSDKNFAVYLGVSRTAALPKGQWLGDPAYANLAANIAIPREDIRRLLAWSPHARGNNYCPPISYELAQSLGNVSSAASSGNETFKLVSATETHDLGPFALSEFPVDYGALNGLIAEGQRVSLGQDGSSGPRVYSYSEVMSADPPSLAGRVALIGDVSRPELSDVFPLIGVNEATPGVFLHACATATLGSPLYEFTPLGEIVVDASIGLIVLAAFVGLTCYFHARPSSQRHENTIQIAVIGLVVLAVIMVSVYFVSATRLLWDDFLLCIFVFAFHRSTHHAAKHLSHRMPELLKHARKNATAQSS
jgi:CHASE2 domain-containing sensor protein